MHLTESVAAGLFYASLALAVGGAILLARRAVERRTGDGRLAFVLLGIGSLGLVLSIGIYIAGPRRMLPF